MQDELVAEAELGEEARRFKESDLYKVMIGLAQQEAALAEKALGKINPRDEAGIVSLQRQITVAEWFEQWLDELIDKGESALEVWKDGQTR